MSASSGISFDGISSTLGAAITRQTNDLMSTISDLAAKKDPNSGDLLLMQMQVQKWSMMTDLQSTIVKSLGDALKGIVQKSG